MKRLSLLAILIVSGCGSDGGSVSLGDFPKAYSEAVCAKNFQCCDASELAGKTMSMCVEQNQVGVALVVNLISGAQARGRVSYDPSQTGTCIKSLEDMSCAQFRQGIGGNEAACMAFLTPQVELGGACQNGFECTSGNCEGGNALSDPPVDGLCMPALPTAEIGESCATVECVDGAYCDSTTTTCQAHKAAGEACTSDTECVNSCDPNTMRCSCYAGCQIGPSAPTGGSMLATALLAAGALVAARRRRIFGPRR